MFFKEFKKKGKNAVGQILFFEFLSLALTLLMCVAAIILIFESLRFEGWLQNLLLSLGTGAAMSALVSFVFYINDKLFKKRERLNNRIIFMKDFKSFYKSIIFKIPFSKQYSTTINTESYIKNQHRWYHDYYKRMFANNATEEETQIRVGQLEGFIATFATTFRECFEYNSNWKNADFSDWEYSRLYSFYRKFKNIEIYLMHKDFFSAFYEFSFLLEDMEEMLTIFIELENFNLFVFKYDVNGKLTINVTKFEEKEPNFKFIREFNNIRAKNYRQYFSKDALKKEAEDYVYESNDSNVNQP